LFPTWQTVPVEIVGCDRPGHPGLEGNSGASGIHEFPISFLPYSRISDKKMLTLSAKSIYGLKATQLLAEHYEQGRLTTKNIASQQNIPRQYLEQIFNQLGRANIIHSVRGKYGGYQLARAPKKIQLLEIIIALEGSIVMAPQDCEPGDAIAEVLHNAEQSFKKTFTLSLADLVEISKKKQHVLQFSI